ncbi:MAG: VOC family protein [Thermomicrobiales bacterium]
MVVIEAVTFDCADTEKLCDFWKVALGYTVKTSSPEWSLIVPLDGTDTGPELGFQRVPEGKVVKNRVHLDLRADGSTIDAEWERLEGLGASTLQLIDDDPDPAHLHFIMADPEGNEFCLLKPE